VSTEAEATEQAAAQSGRRPAPPSEPPREVPQRSKAVAMLVLLRPPQWAKNVFVLAPLMFAKKLDEAGAVVDAVAATAVFCLIASAVYVGNDWRDRAEDAEHPRKRVRPLASGELGAREATIAGIGCVIGALAIGLAAGLPWQFWVVMAVYVGMNVGYSLRLRHVQLVDVLIIAAGFVLRVLAGTTAIDVPASQFIVLSSGLLALLLAMGKRRIDLSMEGTAARRSLTGYSLEFIDVALATLAASVIGFYALFTVSDYAIERYHSQDLYLTTFWVAVGILRYLQVVLAHGHQGGPTEIALGDRFMQVVVAGWAATFIVIAYLL
jgi:decaprenyl-phosphate phosphoribosyltransferase